MKDKDINNPFVNVIGAFKSLNDEEAGKVFKFVLLNMAWISLTFNQRINPDEVLDINQIRELFGFDTDDLSNPVAAEWAIACLMSLLRGESMPDEEKWLERYAEQNI